MVNKRPADELTYNNTLIYRSSPLDNNPKRCRWSERWQIVEDKHAIWVNRIIGILTGLEARGFGK